MIEKNSKQKPKPDSKASKRLLLIIIGITAFMLVFGTALALFVRSKVVDEKVDEQVVEVIEPTITPSPTEVPVKSETITLFFSNSTDYPTVEINVLIPDSAEIEYGGTVNPLAASIINQSTKLYFEVVHAAVDVPYKEYEEISEGIYRVTRDEGEISYVDEVQIEGRCRDVPTSIVNAPCGLPILGLLTVQCEGDDIEFCDQIVKNMSIDEYSSHAMNQPGFPDTLEEVMHAVFSDKYEPETNTNATEIVLGNESFELKMYLEPDSQGGTYPTIPDYQELNTNFSSKLLYRISGTQRKYYYTSFFELVDEGGCEDFGSVDEYVACGGSVVDIDTIDKDPIFHITCSELKEGGVEECDNFVSNELYFY